ncbi:MAG: outer membrane lipid asymmetry maintenance protein MlaD [Rickettsiaceae bacterium]|nr:outer membrane lipid asymmetry maintenance protein MlaD [Rickettsiaceae bacterium]
MKQNTLETILGFAVILTALIFLFYSYSQKNKDSYEEYHLAAKFDSIDGIINGSDVQIAGIIVGRVSSLTLDPETYSAIATLSIAKHIQIPTDSRASVSSSGFLGGKYISITPGGDDEFLKDGGQIKYTQSSINLESLIGKFMYSGNAGSSGGAQKPSEKDANSQTIEPAAPESQAK